MPPVASPAMSESQAAAISADSDLALLRRHVELRDHGAFGEIIRRYAGVLYGTCHRILRDDARAQDVSQETFFRLLQIPYAVTHSRGGWLHRPARHLAW